MRNPAYVAPVDPVETLVHSIAYWIQTAREVGNPPEAVFKQGEPEDTVHTPFGLTAEEANQLFEFDSERIELLRWNYAGFRENTYQEKRSLFEDMWTDAPSNWADYDEMLRQAPFILEVAQRWNHPASGMSDFEVAVLLIANLHQESHLRRDNSAANHPSNQVGVIKDILGDASATFGGDSSLGPANLRPTVLDEILGAAQKRPIIPMSDDTKDDFHDEGRLDALEREWQSFGGGLEGNRARIAFLYDPENAIELMGANFYRGIVRLEDAGVQPTMFNMSAWMSQGIAESPTLRTAVGEEVTAAIDHASDTVRFVDAIIANRETFGLFSDSDAVIDWDEFVLFNDDDLRAYLRDK